MALNLQDGTDLLLQDGTALELQADAGVTITQQPQDVTVFDTIAGTATFTVVAEPEPLTYQWYEAVAGLLVGETASSITVPAQLVNSGEVYYCDVSGVLTNNATLTVNKANLNFYEQPQNASVVEGIIATFTVEAAGWEPITYQWYETTAGLLVGETGTSLSFQTSLAQDGNSYYCIVTDGYADTYQSDTATLSVVAELGTGPQDIRILTPSGQWVQISNTPVEETVVTVSTTITRVVGGPSEQRVVCTNNAPITITLTGFNIGDEVTVIRADALVSVTSGNGLLINGLITQTLQSTYDAASLVLTAVGWVAI